MDLDNESRANRLHLALDGLAALLGSQPQGIVVESCQTGCIVALLAEEARLLAATFDPRHPAGVND